MIIDSHVHISDYRKPGMPLTECFDELNRDMDKNGISYAIIIPDNIEDLTSIADLKTASKLIEGKRNFFLLGSPQIIQRGSSELNSYKKLLKDGKIKGLKFFPGHDPYFPNDERCLPYYDLGTRFDIPVVFHTGENSGDSTPAKFNDPKYIREIADKFPKLRIVITHFYWPMIDYCWETTRDKQNIYFDLAAIADPEIVQASGGIEKIRKFISQIIEQSPDRIMFGTDWPMCSTENHTSLVESLNLSPEIKNKIYFANANSIYKLGIG